MEKKYKLIIWDENWADEFNIFGFDIIEESNFNKVFNIISECNKNKLSEALDGEYGFGTNEGMEFDSDDIINMFETAQTISQSEFNVLNKLFSLENLEYDVLESRGQSFLNNILERLVDNNIISIKRNFSIEKIKNK